MIITGMTHFEVVCHKKLVEWYHKNRPNVKFDAGDIFVVWAYETLKNYKYLALTTDDGIYAEYTYNDDKQELHENVYEKITSACYTEE